MPWQLYSASVKPAGDIQVSLKMSKTIPKRSLKFIFEVILLKYAAKLTLTVSSQLLIISPSLYILYPILWGKTNYQMHKSQNYYLKTLLGFSECQKSFFMIVIPNLWLSFGLNYSILLALKLVPLLHFTLRMMGKVNIPTARLKKSYVCIFISNLYQHG